MLEQALHMNDSELARARHNMIEQQIRPWDVLDERVLRLLAETPRDQFVPPDYRRLAYADIAVPLGHGQVMMPPRVEARLLQSLDIRSTDDILEVGTGSGYLTALLASVGHHVYSVEIFPDFVAQAHAALDRHGIHNVTLETGDAARGWDKHGPYDVIAVTGSLPVMPEAFQAALRPGGRMFVVVGDPPVMEATLVTRVGPQAWINESLFETELPPLINAPQPARFVF
jgi:protein-L-isoaspartate(D-aspartate) O-methyltransferase